MLALAIVTLMYLRFICIVRVLLLYLSVYLILFVIVFVLAFVWLVSTVS